MGFVDIKAATANFLFVDSGGQKWYENHRFVL